MPPPSGFTPGTTLPIRRGGSNPDHSDEEAAPRAGRPPYVGPGRRQNAASSSSITDRSVASAMARSAVTFGSTVRAKNWAAATLPS
jgi:acyl dehydratase